MSRVDWQRAADACPWRPKPPPGRAQDMDGRRQLILDVHRAVRRACPPGEVFPAMVMSASDWEFHVRGGSLVTVRRRPSPAAPWELVEPARVNSFLTYRRDRLGD